MRGSALNFQGGEFVGDLAALGEIGEPGGFIEKNAGTAAAVDEACAAPGGGEGVVGTGDEGIMGDAFSGVEGLQFGEGKDEVAAAFP